MTNFLTSTEYTKYHNLLKKRGVIFTDSVVYRNFLPLNERGYKLKIKSYITSLISVYSKDISLYFTNVDILYREDDKHATGFCLNTSGKKAYLQFFDCNGEIDSSDNLYKLLSRLASAIEVIISKKVVIVCTNRKNINNLGTGNCAAWTYYFYTFIFENENINPFQLVKIIEGWKTKDVISHNSYIRSVI